MKVSEISTRSKPSLSFEMFPPKKPENLFKFIETAHQLETLSPDFISITYGAGGGTKDTTIAMASEINKTTPVVVHLTCDGLTNEILDVYLKSLKEHGIENILALRGDKYDSEDFSGCIDLIKAIKKRSDLCIGCACYPEPHPDSKGYYTDIHYYVDKVLAGCRFFVTQMSFNVGKIQDFISDLQIITGKEVPIRVGLMPILKKQTILKILETKDMAVNVPYKFLELLRIDAPDEVIREEGIKYCIEQINHLLVMGIRNIHLYTMNDYEATKEIVEGSWIGIFRGIDNG